MSSQLNEFSFRDLLDKLSGKKDTTPVADAGSEDNMDDAANTGNITPGQSYRAPAMSFADKYDRSPIKTYDLPPATTRSENPPGTENEPFDLDAMEKDRASADARDSLRNLFKRDTERQPVKVNTNPGTKPKYTGVTKAVDDAATWVGDKVDQGWDAVKDYFNEPGTTEPKAADAESSWLDGVVDRYKRFYGAGDKKAPAPKPAKPADTDAATSADDALSRLMADPEFTKMLDK
jgi:hypothetical protein